MKTTWVVVGVFALIIFGVIMWWPMRTTSLTEIRKQENNATFRAILFDPIPDGFRDIFGFEDQIGRPTTYLTFTVSNDAFPALLQVHDYAEVPCIGPLAFMEPPMMYQKDMDFWNPQAVKNSICYHSNQANAVAMYSNSLRSAAISIFLLDKDTNNVFFVEIGN